MTSNNLGRDVAFYTKSIAFIDLLISNRILFLSRRGYAVDIPSMPRHQGEGVGGALH